MLLVSTIFVLALCSCAGPVGPPGLSGPAGQEGPAGPAVVSVTGASVDSSENLVITLSNGQTIDVGNVAKTQAASAFQPGVTTLTMGDHRRLSRKV